MFLNGASKNISAYLQANIALAVRFLLHHSIFPNRFIMKAVEQGIVNSTTRKRMSELEEQKMDL